jgi:hypothetical protein
MPITEDTVIEEVVEDAKEDAHESADPEKKQDEEDTTQEETKGEESEEVVVTIGDEKPPEEEVAAPDWVRELRHKHREAQKRIKELEGKLNNTPETKTPELGAKPTLEGCEYDSEKFETALTTWHDKKRQVEADADKKKKAEEDDKKAWQDKLDAYGTSKTELKVKDFEESEATVLDLFGTTQQGIVIQGADNPALVIYAIGKNPAKAKELAAIKDPVKFAFAIAKLESQLKVQSKKPVPAPEKVVTGTGRSSGSVDSTLERLRAQAEKTGDMTPVIEYKRKKKAA